jgi:uncharacterized protein
VYRLLEELNLSLENSNIIKLALKGKDLKQIAEKFNMGEYTLNDIILNLEKPEMDIRDSVDPIIFKKDILSFDDIEEGMILEGKVTNVLDFGAFIDIGLKNDGLVHISEIADKFIKHPSDILSVGMNISVKVINVDKDRGRISLSMKNFTPN